MTTPSFRTQAYNYALKRKTGVTSADLQKKFSVGRSTASALLSQVLIPSDKTRRNPITGKLNTVYMAYDHGDLVT